MAAGDHMAGARRGCAAGIFTLSSAPSTRRSLLTVWPREAGENPARPPPLSPGTPRAASHWTREIGTEPVARPGRCPQADDPEARRPAGRHASRTGFHERGASSDHRSAGRLSNRREFRRIEREVRMTTAVLLVLLGALSRLFPNRLRFVPLAAGLLLATRPAAAQEPPPVSENVVVT